jgi:hypothetical protein
MDHSTSTLAFNLNSLPLALLRCEREQVLHVGGETELANVEVARTARREAHVKLTTTERRCSSGAPHRAWQARNAVVGHQIGPQMPILAEPNSLRLMAVMHVEHGRGEEGDAREGELLFRLRFVFNGNNSVMALISIWI